jgi:hypothetical protein
MATLVLVRSKKIYFDILVIARLAFLLSKPKITEFLYCFLRIELKVNTFFSFYV